MRNSECVIRNGATAPHTAARRKTPLLPRRISLRAWKRFRAQMRLEDAVTHIAARKETLLSGRVMREYRSALTTA